MAELPELSAGEAFAAPDMKAVVPEVDSVVPSVGPDLGSAKFQFGTLVVTIFLGLIVIMWRKLVKNGKPKSYDRQTVEEYPDQNKNNVKQY